MKGGLSESHFQAVFSVAYRDEKNFFQNPSVVCTWVVVCKLRTESYAQGRFESRRMF
jgi:hypothetical protein